MLPSYKGYFPPISSLDHEKLNKQYSIEEIGGALFQMGPFKASRIDGYHVAFFQKIWHILEPLMWKFVDNFFNHGVLPKHLNETLLVLVPKNPNPEFTSQFCPISLWTLLYKLLAKTIVNQMKPLLSKIIILT